MSKKSVHVVPNGSEWGVKIAGNERSSKNFNTQKEAAVYGRERAIINESELVIHRPNGQIREKNSYGNDPRNIKG
jgi:hypothetical protein